ncbi:MAG: permease [Clostridium butyricum]|nr:permease [Clostridium butyricum]
MKGSSAIFTFLAGGIILYLIYVCKTMGLDIVFKEVGDFSIIFTSIILDSIPFIIIGSIVSAVIQLFISEELIEKVIPKSNIIGYIGAALIGLIFPVCECAIVPITRRLIRKGVPVGLGVTFMLSVPIVNPVVIMSTYYAFYDKQSMVLIRTIGGFACAIIIGLIVNLLQGNDECLSKDYIGYDNCCSCGCNSIVDSDNKFIALIEHTNREFMDITRYLILGAMLSSMFQIAQSKGGFTFITENKVIAIVFMMFLGFALSLCSEADAFVGKSFLEIYSFSGVAAFLLIGPMLDLKNFIMLTGGFKKEFISKLSFVTLGVVFIVSCIFMMCGV